ncbi:MAG TPA: cell division protein FtsZ [Chitinophagaceae bacterium]|nr:cell division protein FtsZ [Chitinophagaceae bacterium]
MIHFDLPKEKSSIIKVIGVGGGGSNAVNYMFNQKIDGVNFIICNTDAQAIAQSEVPNKIQLGPHLTQGLGAGANPEIGRQATEESLEEIRRILEVNTKMAFITAGMGGGTGTGGTPIISKICKDLGILTVGIVTTPFAYEGKKRIQQADEGIKILKQYVDTLLVISNDKLRHQFGNLKMREAFAKADNVLATAAKCITDVISSTGQINVDFADVCTVMKNGGVAILGSAAAEGENRAQKAIEEALNSPLLNDSDIRGAKWILININSAEGDHEFTMDEVEVIQNYILTQAGDNSDVILGLGYDNSLDKKIGITLIATGFQHKDPFAKTEPDSHRKKKKEKEEEKIIMVLGQPNDMSSELPVKEEVNEEKKAEDTLAPRMVENVPAANEPVSAMMIVEDDELEEEEKKEYILQPEKETPVIIWDLNESGKTPGENTGSCLSGTTGEKFPIAIKKQELHSARKPENPGTTKEENKETKNSTTPVSAASGGYLARPSNIYAETQAGVFTPTPSAEEPVPSKPIMNEEQELFNMKLVERDDIPAADKPLAHQTQEPLVHSVEDSALQDEAEDQKRRAAERLKKLRNLSFNINAADPNNEFETVPAFIRRNMELYGNSSTAVENFYSNYEVKTDDNNQTKISTINTFLDGKKPD